MQSVARGAFIVLEGIDRCGKTTQSKRLCDWLNSSGHRAKQMRFPDRTTEIGKMIDAYLQSKVEVDDRAIHLLFAANRWEQSEIIRKELMSGCHLIVDRYSFSGVAFSSAKGLDLNWCFQPEKGLPAPDAVLYLDLPVEAAQKRGDYGAERYEKVDMQRRVAEAFQKMKTDQWLTVDATRSQDEMHEQIKKLTTEVLSRVSSAAGPGVIPTL